MTQRFTPRAGLRGVSLVLIATAATTLAGCSRLGSSGDPHLIGHLAPRTGPEQAAGIRLGVAVAAVVEEFNRDDPKTIEQRPITIVHGDTGAELDGFTFQATRLLTVNRVAAVIGGTDVSQVERIIPSVQTTNGILVSPSGRLPGGSGPSVWPVGLCPSERGKYLARHAASDLKLTEIVAIVDQSHPIFPAIREAFEAEFQNADRRIKPELAFHNERELGEVSSKLADLAPKAILFCGKARDLLQLRAMIGQNKMVENVPTLFGGEEEEAVFQNEAKRSDGIVFSTAFSLEDKSARIQNFATDFRNRCNQPPDVDAALSADSIRILLAAAKKAQTFKRESLLKELEKLEVDCLTGPFWFAKDQAARRTVYVVQMRSGSARLQKAYPPEKK